LPSPRLNIELTEGVCDGLADTGFNPAEIEDPVKEVGVVYVEAHLRRRESREARTDFIEHFDNLGFFQCQIEAVGRDNIEVNLPKSLRLASRLSVSEDGTESKGALDLKIKVSTI
jgi:hypothetical protein